MYPYVTTNFKKSIRLSGWRIITSFSKTLVILLEGGTAVHMTIICSRAKKDIIVVFKVACQRCNTQFGSYTSFDTRPFSVEERERVCRWRVCITAESQTNLLRYSHHNTTWQLILQAEIFMTTSKNTPDLFHSGIHYQNLWSNFHYLHRVQWVILCRCPSAFPYRPGLLDQSHGTQLDLDGELRVSGQLHGKSGGPGLWETVLQW